MLYSWHFTVCQWVTQLLIKNTFKQQKAENGEEFKNVQPHDVASLVKQFFRQLPEPLLTVLLHDCFVKTQRMEDQGDQTEAVLLLCLLLPIPHLSTLQFTMRFLAKVASHSQHSKMGTSNLAIVLTPNLIHNTKKEGNNVSEKQLKEQTAVIDILLKNADDIGLVNEDIYERAKIIGDEFVDGLTSSGDELEADLRRTNKRQSRTRTRTGSLSGMLLSKLQISNQPFTRDQLLKTHQTQFTFCNKTPMASVPNQLFYDCCRLYTVKPPISNHQNAESSNNEANSNGS